MAISMVPMDGNFSAEGFRLRAGASALPLQAAAGFEHVSVAARGDHELNPDLAHTGEAAPARPAGVLIGIMDRGEEATVLLTRRADHLSVHAGQISFPGGRMDRKDPSAVHTALREAHEEIGLDPAAVAPIGLLDPYRTRTGFNILPVLALVSPDVKLRADEREVADIFEVPLQFLMTAGNHRRYSVKIEGKARHFYAMPYGERYIWGATAGILRIMYERLYAG